MTSPLRSEVRSEMVATVLEVMTREGAAVSAGDTLILLESMKMEIPVVADVSGVVARLAAHPGASVQANELLAVIDTYIQ